MKNNDQLSPLNECFQIFPQAIMACEKIGKHSFIGNDWPFFKYCFVLLYH